MGLALGAGHHLDPKPVDHRIIDSAVKASGAPRSPEGGASSA
jgi:hypothetical protein